MEWIIGIVCFIAGFFSFAFVIRNTIPKNCIIREEHDVEMGFKNRKIKELEANQKEYHWADEKWSGGTVEPPITKVTKKG